MCTEVQDAGPIATFENGLESAHLHIASFIVNRSKPIRVTFRYSYVINSPTVQLELILKTPENYPVDIKTISGNRAQTVEKTNSGSISECATATISKSGNYRVVLVANKIRFTSSAVTAVVSDFVIGEAPCSSTVVEELVTAPASSGKGPEQNVYSANRYVSEIYDRREG